MLTLQITRQCDLPHSVNRSERLAVCNRQVSPWLTHPPCLFFILDSRAVNAVCTSWICLRARLAMSRISFKSPRAIASRIGGAYISALPLIGVVAFFDVFLAVRFFAAFFVGIGFAFLQWN